MKQTNINDFEEILYEKTLENGLKVYLVPISRKNNYYCMIGTKFGGEVNCFLVDKEINYVPTGIAHFLEHKLFEHETLNPSEFFYESGTDLNASTTSEYTNYYFQGNQKFYDNLKYFLKWITTFSTTKEKVEKEQGIILEEARMHMDNPDRILYEKLKNNTLVSHSRKNKVIGTDEDIINIKKEDLELCFNSFYRPDNMFLIITGKFDVNKTIKLIEKELKNFNNPKTIIEKIFLEEADNVNKEYEELYLDVEIPRLAVSVKINKQKFTNLNLDNEILEYYLQMILSLGFSNTSVFKESLILKGLISSFGTQYNEIKDHYLLNFIANTNKPKELLNEINNYFLHINLLEEDFIRMKKTWIASEIRMTDNINAMASVIMDDVLDYDTYKTNSIETIKKLDFKILKKVLDTIPFDNKATIIIFPKEN